MSGLHKYRDIFGKPGEGLHSWRVGGLAGVDLLITAGAAFALSRAIPGLSFPGSSLAKFLVTLIILIVAAVGVHYAFGVETALNKKLGLVPAPKI